MNLAVIRVLQARGQSLHGGKDLLLDCQHQIYGLDGKRFTQDARCCDAEEVKWSLTRQF